MILCAWINSILFKHYNAIFKTVYKVNDLLQASNRSSNEGPK